MRGLTILEILIVLAVLIGIGALVAPTMLGVMEDRALDSTSDIAQQQLLLARAHAQSSGRPVEVAYRPQPGRIIARYFEAGERGVAEGDRLAAARRGEEDVFAAGDVSGAQPEASIGDADTLVQHWGRRVLPSGIMLSRNPPPEPNDVGAASSPREPPFADAPWPARLNALAEQDLERPIRLAVFLPDGSTMLASPVWLMNTRDRAIRLHVSVWTGLPRAAEWSQMDGEEVDEAHEGALLEGADEKNVSPREERP